jgi:hypothetical protein
MTDDVTPAWEHLDLKAPSRDLTPVSLATTEAMYQVKMAADSPGGLACLVYDEELAARAIYVNDHAAIHESIPQQIGALHDTTVLKDTDAFARQGDKGPYHWAQGPQDLEVVTTPAPPPTPPVNPSPNPEPTKPGQLPRKGQAVTTSNLRLRKRPMGDVLGVMPTGTTVLLTGGRKRHEGSLWVRIKVDASEIRQTRLTGADTWLSPPKAGWVNSEYLAVPQSEYVSLDFPDVTHRFLWWLDDAGGLNPDDVRRTLTAIMDDPRGPLRAGIDMVEATTPDQAHILVRFVDDACGGAAGCYYKRLAERARVDIAKQWFSTAWLSRVWIHEAVGHAATRSYDHYQNAPQYPRSDYYGIMGDWQSHYGDHAWPDGDDVENWRDWCRGNSPYVYVRDLES